MAMPAIRYAAKNELVAEKKYLQLAIDNCKPVVDLPPFYQAIPKSSRTQVQLKGENRAFLTAQYERKAWQKSQKSPQVQLPVLTPVKSVKAQCTTISKPVSQPNSRSTLIRHKQAATPEQSVWLSELGVCALLVMPYLLIGR